MPCKLEGPVLTVDPNVIHKVDTKNAENLFSMWTVFARCADSVEQGRRLENLSWRVWQRETFCCRNQEPEASPTPSASQPQNIPDNRIPELPQLSGSVDSVVEDEAVEEYNNISEPVEIVRPRIVRQDSYASSRSRSRGQERHLTSDNLEKMVVSIIQEKEPNLQPLADISSPSIEPQSDASQASSPDMEPTPSTAITVPASASLETCSEVNSQSTSSAEVPSSQSRTTVVRGFSPSHVSIPSFRSIPQQHQSPSPSAIPEPKSSPAPKPVQPKKQPPKFALGGSSGEESSPQSLEVRKPVAPPKKKLFQVGGSSGEDSSSLKSALHSSRPDSLLAPPKQTSFNHQVAMRTIQTPSDQSDSYVDESAIDDDDEDSDWEDSIEESGKSSVENFDFKRVDSKANLASHRSLISLMVAHDRAQTFGNHASQSSSAIPQRARTFQSGLGNVKSTNEPEDHGLVMKRGLRPTPLKPINEVPRSAAQPIMVNAQPHHQQAALSPRTTRRNMLATELTESLRRQLLWERQQKTSTANAVLKRRHTSHDVANLKQYPERPCMNKGNDEPNASSWNQYFNRESFGGYHAQGW